MKKAELKGLKKGSADFVIAHSLVRKRRGKKPSMLFCGVLDPEKALFFAMLTKKFGTDISLNTDRTCPLLNTDKFNGKYIAMLSFNNSLVISSGTNVEKVLNKARQRGVVNPVIVFVPFPEDRKIFRDF